MGMILVGISVLGIVGCCVALLMTGRIFKKQKEQLLEEIEKEQQGGTDEENIESEDTVEPDSSPSGSESTPKSYLEQLKERYSKSSKKIQKRREELESEFAYAKEWGQTDYDDFWEWLAYEKFPEQDYSFLSNSEEDEAQFLIFFVIFKLL